MAHLMCYRKVLLLSVLLFILAFVCSSAWPEPQLIKNTELSSSSSRRRTMLEVEKQEQDEKPFKKKVTSQSIKNHTKIIKPNTFSSKNQTKTIKSNNISTKNQTKTIKSNNISTKTNTISSKNQTKSNNTLSIKNQTKTIKPSNLNSTKTAKSNNLSSKNQTKVTSSLPKKLNSTTTTTTTTPKIKKLNSTSNSISTSNKKSLDLVKASNKITKATKTQTLETSKKPKKQTPPSWIIEEEEQEDNDDDDDLVSEFRDLPNRFQRTLIPDLERISTTSKAYITKANNEITKGFKPYVGKKHASTIATIVSSAFMLIPLLLVSLVFNKIKAYFSLQKILIFIQVYLSIYFTILCITSLVTGIEPLKFLFSTSQSTYVCFQVLQTLGYVFYLLLLVMYLVLVFSTDCGLGSRFLGLAQVFVGLAVGLHYYVTVVHRVVLRQTPKSNWKIHGIYAACFFIICVFVRVDTRKKAYVENDGEEGKKN